MTALVDSNNLPIPVCNIESADVNSNFYVDDKNLYEQTKKNADFYGQMTAANCLIATLFLVILSLNASVGILNLANLVLFSLILCTSAGLVFAFKKWTASTTIVNQMEIDGTPCQIPKQESTVIYTSKSSY